MNKTLTITQGNTESPVFKLNIKGEPVIASEVKKVEFSFGSEAVVKTYPNDGATFEKEAFCVHLTQQDTFKLSTGKSRYQIRVYFNDDTVKATPQLPMVVNPSISKAVLV